MVVAMKDPGDVFVTDDINRIAGGEVIPIQINEEIIKGYIEEVWQDRYLDHPYEPVDFFLESSRKIRSPETGPIRPISKFPEVLHFEMLDLDGTEERTIKAGDQPGTWKCSAYAIDGFDFAGVEKEIPATKECYLEIDAPAATGEGDEIEVSIRYNTGSADRAGILRLDNVGEMMETEVTGEGLLEFILTKPGEITAEIRAGKSADRVVRNILPLRKGITTINRFQILHKGETLTGGNIEIYPSMPSMIEDCVESLLGYPYGCAEQASSKLYGLSIAYQHAVKGRIGKRPEDISKFIIPGLNRLVKFFHQPGVFSLWEGGTPSTEVTAIVAKNLILFKGLHFEMADIFLREASYYLKHREYKNNRLLPLGREFLSESRSLSDMTNFCIHSRDSEEIPEFAERIKELMNTDTNRICWGGKYPDYWAGDLEATCEALSALWIAGETDLCFRGINPIMENMKEGRLYSTSDTVAFLRLLDIMNVSFSDEVEISGKIISHTSDSIETIPAPRLFTLSDKLRVSGVVKAVSGDIMTRITETEEVDYLDMEKGLNLNLELSLKAPFSYLKPIIENQGSIATKEEKNAESPPDSQTERANGSAGNIPPPQNEEDNAEIIEIPVLSELDDDVIYEAFLSHDEERARKAMEKLFPTDDCHQTSGKKTDSEEIRNRESGELGELDPWFIEPPPPPESTGEIREKTEDNIYEIETDTELADSPGEELWNAIPPVDDPEASGPEFPIFRISSEDLGESAPFHMAVGKKAFLTINPFSWSLCPLCRILLPGNLALLKSGGNVQHACIPIKNGVSGKRQGTADRHNMGGYINIDGAIYHYTPETEPKDFEIAPSPTPLTVEIVAIRKGKGKIFVVLTDMYDSGKKELSRGIEVVTE